MRAVGWMLVLLGFLAPSLRADRAASLEKIDSVFANKMSWLARTAFRNGSRASAISIWRRVLEVVPEHRESHIKLGFRKRDGAWVERAEAKERLAAAKDADWAETRRVARDRQKIEDWRIDQVIEVCQAHQKEPGWKDPMMRLLGQAPRNAKLHRALGHERIGDSYARPELAPIVRNMVKTVAAWAKIRAQKTNLRLARDTYDLPGYRALPMVRLGKRYVLHDGPSFDAKEIARASAHAAQFVDEMIQKPGGSWTPRISVFVNPAGYRAVLEAISPEPTALARRLKYQNFSNENFYMWRCESVAMAMDAFSHRCAYRTMARIAAPVLPGQDKDVKVPKRDLRANAWLREGFGYFASLELFNTAMTRTVSTSATERKRYTRDAPHFKLRNRLTIIDWVGEQVAAGVHVPLTDLVGQSLNNLDELGSFQAYTFLRFLYFVEPQATADFFVVLSEQTEGAPFVRVDRALRRTHGRSLKELERLWRLFLLEIRQS